MILKNCHVLRNEYQFIFKLHPTEESYFPSEIEINMIGKYNNFRFANNSSSISNLFATSKYVLGVFSAALFEASYLGCKVIILNLDGAIMASSLIENDNARLIEPTDKLKNFLEHK